MHRSLWELSKSHTEYSLKLGQEAPDAVSESTVAEAAHSMS